MSDRKELCTKACNHLRYLVRSGHYGEFLVKMKGGVIYHANENKSLKFGETERGNDGNDHKKD
jgi:hypothetical protein